MKLIITLAGLLLWTSPLMAESYSWVDANGTYNFTEDYSHVPKKYRGKVDRRGDMGGAPLAMKPLSPATGAIASPPTALKNAPAGKPESPAENNAGKKYNQLKQEFSEREAAMWLVRKRVDEIDTLLKDTASDKEQAQRLVSERDKAVEQFNEMRKQYDQQVELARKAGIQVDIKK